MLNNVSPQRNANQNHEFRHLVQRSERTELWGTALKLQQLPARTAAMQNGAQNMLVRTWGGRNPPTAGGQGNGAASLENHPAVPQSECRPKSPSNSFLGTDLKEPTRYPHTSPECSGQHCSHGQGGGHCDLLTHTEPQHRPRAPLGGEGEEIPLLSRLLGAGAHAPGERRPAPSKALTSPWPSAWR